MTDCDTCHKEIKQSAQIESNEKDSLQMECSGKGLSDIKVTFKHLRLEAWEGATSAKARGRAFQAERRASYLAPS